MATLKQMEFFASLHRAELDRTVALRDGAKTYIGLTSLYSGFALLASGVARPAGPLSIALFAATMIVLLLAVLAAMLVTQVSVFEAVADPVGIIARFGEAPPNDEEFFDDRIADYSVATVRNRAVNNRKARLLATAGYLFLTGLTLHATFFLTLPGPQGAS